MKVYYRYCKKCAEAKPKITYFLSKEENKKLTDEDKKLCYECYLKKEIQKVERAEALECYKRLRRKGIKVLLRARYILRNSRRGQQELF